MYHFSSYTTLRFWCEGDSVNSNLKQMQEYIPIESYECGIST